MAVSLTATEYGHGKPVAILHGLFGAGRNWAGVARRLAGHYRVVALDLRNHGGSAWADTMDYGEMAEDVRAGMLARGHRNYALIGHSMGGKVAMMAALQDTAAVERLVVVDVAPVAYSIPYHAHVTAMRRLDLAAITRRSDADTALAAASPTRPSAASCCRTWYSAAMTGRAGNSTSRRSTRQCTSSPVSRRCRRR
jgi:esterase